MTTETQKQYYVVFGSQDPLAKPIREHHTSSIEEAVTKFLAFCADAKDKYTPLDEYREKFFPGKEEDEFEGQNIGSVELLLLGKEDSEPPALEDLLQLPENLRAELRTLCPWFFENPTGSWLTSGNLYIP
jgi:hypothetical protein